MLRPPSPDTEHSCHLCFRCNAYSDTFPLGTNWLCSKHWLAHSWHCKSCNRVTWGQWGAAEQCSFCSFKRYSILDTASIIKNVWETTPITAEDCDESIECLVSRMKEYTVGHWSVEDYEHVMSLPKVVTDGWGTETTYMENHVWHLIYLVVHNNACTNTNLVRVACYAKLLASPVDVLKGRITMTKTLATSL